MYFQTFILSTALKVLLFNGYHSTDFEVHRNWLALTNSLPINKWYFENTSEWTLDYPPFFAWFECFLSQFATYLDFEMLKIENLNYKSTQTIYFQRFTVILSELTLFFALYRLKELKKVNDGMVKSLVVLTFLSPSLFIVDHIHFQYNGFMFGILLLSLVEATKKQYLLSGILFAILLNFKHIYLYLAPAYFVFLLRAYCMNANEGGVSPFLFLTRLSLLGLSVILVFLISFAPFIYYDQVPQVLSRLFPFQRGLTHAYWAPNFWAIYSFADRVLAYLASKWDPNFINVQSITRGLVGDVQFAILPQIKPIHTFLFTLIAQFPILYKLWYRPNEKTFLKSIVLCGFASYLFGWHVHEKAIMLVLLPSALTALDSQFMTNFYIFINVVGCFSLFPLIFYTTEFLIISLILVIWTVFAYSTLHPIGLSLTNKFYYFGLLTIGVLLLRKILDIPFFSGLPFLPLMLTSVYCSIGIVISFLSFYNYSLNVTIY